MSDTAVFETPLTNLFLGPCEWSGGLVLCGDECIDVLLKLLDGGEGGAGQGLALKDRKPSFDLIEPRRTGWDEMEMHLRVFLEPALVLLMRVEVIKDDVKLAIREGGHKAVHKAEELDPASPF